jgi:hypothetical protein
MFNANSEIRVWRSATAANGITDVELNGSAFNDTDSRAMARVDSLSVINKGGAASTNEELATAEEKRTFDARGPTLRL